MTMRSLLLAALACACLSASCAATPTQADRRTGDVVVLVSFDGFRHDYLDRGITPNFSRLARAGVRADALIPVFPSKTFPNHHSIVTGMYADRHGIVGNEFHDPVLGTYGTRTRADPGQGRWFGGEPIWITAERQGVRTAAFFWVATDTDIDGMRPTYWKKYDRSVPGEIRVDSVIAWLGRPAPERPRLVLLYFELIDDAGHEHGPDAAQTDSAIVHADALLGRLMDGLRGTPAAARTSLVVVSDHGMAAVDPARTEAIDVGSELTGARNIVWGAYSTLYFDGDTVRAAAAASALRRSLRHARVYERAAIPARFHWQDSPRIPDVLILADEGWLVGLRRDLERVRPGGTHGYDPALRSMQGIFLVMGPRIKANARIPAFENVHIHPLLARLLGIEPAPAIDGRAEVLDPVLW